jgi:hypothetical protein
VNTPLLFVSFFALSLNSLFDNGVLSWFFSIKRLRWVGNIVAKLMHYAFGTQPLPAALFLVLCASAMLATIVVVLCFSWQSRSHSRWSPQANFGQDAASGGCSHPSAHQRIAGHGRCPPFEHKLVHLLSGSKYPSRAAGKPIKHCSGSAEQFCFYCFFVIDRDG